MARVFLTGASGLLGGALLDRLRERGDTVVALARSQAAADALAARGAQVAHGDLLDEDALAAGMAGCDLAFNVAGVNTLCPADPGELFHVNVRGAEIAVRAAARAGVGRLVHTSSAGALGEGHGVIGDERTVPTGQWLSVYARTKHEGEVAAFAAARRAGLDFVSVNPSSVQGPGRSGGTGKILIAYLNGRLKVFIDTHISLVDMADCAEGHLLAAERGTAGERYVLNGATITSQEALVIMRGLTGVTDEVRILPPQVAVGAAAVLEKGFALARREPPVCRAMVRTMLHGHRYDGSRATRDLGLVYTPVEQTFSDTVAWAVETGRVTRPLPSWPGVAGTATG